MCLRMLQALPLISILLSTIYSYLELESNFSNEHIQIEIGVRIAGKYIAR